MAAEVPSFTESMKCLYDLSACTVRSLIPKLNSVSSSLGCVIFTCEHCSDWTLSLAEVCSSSAFSGTSRGFSTDSLFSVSFSTEDSSAKILVIIYCKWSIHCSRLKWNRNTSVFFTL